MGPIFFNIYMNDLSYAIDECTLFMYADDTQLFKSAENIDQVELATNADLKKVDEWYEFNQMKDIIQNISLKKMLPFELRIDIYRAFIAPHFNYCSESWHHCGKRGSSKLEKISERALPFVTRDKSTTYETLLKQLNLLSPFNQRIVKMATGVYKAIHGYKVPRGIGELLHE